MTYKFYAFWHPNITGKHRTTLEFTKDNHLTKNGDCIIGVNSDFEIEKLKEYHKKARMKIGMDNVIGYINEEFYSDREIVIRKSDFISKRTLIYKANKSAIDIDADYYKKLKENGKVKIEIENVHLKAIFFDFDDTLEDWTRTDYYVHKWIYKSLMIVANLSSEMEAKRLWEKAKAVIRKRGFFDKYNREEWIKEFARQNNISLNKNFFREWEEKYWHMRKVHAKPIPYARYVINRLKKNYKIAILTDSDGKPRFKYDRMDKFDFYFDTRVIGNDIKENKPSEKFYKLACKRLRIKPYEAIMIGDSPERDLKPAKILGLTTIWFDRFKEKKEYNYVDYKINDLREVIKIAKDLEQKRD